MLHLKNIIGSPPRFDECGSTTAGGPGVILPRMFSRGSNLSGAGKGLREALVHGS